MKYSSETINYEGTFIYTHGPQTETMKVTRFTDQNGFKEKIVSLNGDASEIFRTPKGVWCYYPEIKKGFFLKPDQSAYRIPGISADQADTLRKYYSTKIFGRERVAGRSAIRARFSPNDAYRYGLELWIDEETGMLLRSDLLGQGTEVIDSYMFVDLQVDPEMLTKTIWRPESLGKDFVWEFTSANNSLSAVQHSFWHVDMVPNGFKVVKHVRSENPFPSEHIVFSDELATVSIFAQKIGNDMQGVFIGESKLGAVHAYGRVIDDYQITVIGEVPADTVQIIGNSVVRLNKLRMIDNTRSE